MSQNCRNITVQSTLAADVIHMHSPASNLSMQPIKTPLGL